MPTNLKSLLSRSRSRNELKSREKEDNECGSNHENCEDGKVETDVAGNTASGSPLENGTLTNPCTSTNETHYRSNFNESCNRVCSPREVPFTSGGYSDGKKMFKSCSTLNQPSTQTTMSPTLPGLFTNFTSTPGAATSSQSTNPHRDEGKFRCQIEFVGGETDCCSGGSNSCPSSGGGAGPACATQSSSHNYHNHHPHLQTPPGPPQFQSSAGTNLPMRKCETVLALSSFSRDNSTSPSDSVGSTASTGSTGKVKLVKDKILSTSSSTLNCLLHSSSRTKLFSSWKLSSSNTNNSASQHFPAFPDFLSPTGSGGGGPTGCHASNVNSCNCRAAADPSFHMHSHHSQHQQISKSQQQLLLPGNNFSSTSGGLGGAPLTPTNRLRRNISITNACFSLSPNSSYSRSSSVASFCWREKVEDSVVQEPEDILCRLCLCNVRMDETVEILGCSCRYCKDCIVAYVSFEIQEGAEDIACPDATCEGQGVLSLPEIESLLPPSLIEKHKKFRMYREVEKDGHLMWCPTPGCETVCRIQEASSEHLSSSPLSSASSGDGILQGSKLSRGSGNRSLIINCATCQKSFCAECKLSWHPGTSCESFRRKLIKQGKLSLEDEELYSLDSIKKCPFCHVPIEKDSGCAQMMCKRCKHVFCWYCLASLDDDFLLRHYDKGPCKNKLGHSRASVVWHRAQVIGIFAGFGVLVLLASPLLILAAPCLLCCRCRYCANKDSEESPVAV